jgi:leucyl aminopeptidase (aminopeptidase T)
VRAFSESIRGAKHLLAHALFLQAGETALLAFDGTTESMLPSFRTAASWLGVKLEELEVPVATNHGQEPGNLAAAKFLEHSRIIALTAFSMAHTEARLSATNKDAKYLSLPQYSLELLAHPMVRADFYALAPLVETVTRKLTLGSTAHVSSEAGTNLSIDISLRKGNYCPGALLPGSRIGSPPDVEANISPNESGSEGVAIVDGSITHPSIGLLRSPVAIEFRRGKAVSFVTEDSRVSQAIDNLFNPEETERRILAELGVGLNPLAELTGAMLSDEGTLGTVHLGLGSNSTVGGKNKVDFHLDFVIRDAVLNIDGETILSGGKILVDES